MMHELDADEDPRKHSCPHCNAAVGDHCRMKNGKRYGHAYHAARVTLARIVRNTANTELNFCIRYEGVLDFLGSSAEARELWESAYYGSAPDEYQAIRNDIVEEMELPY